MKKTPQKQIKNTKKAKSGRRILSLKFAIFIALFALVGSIFIYKSFAVTANNVSNNCPSLSTRENTVFWYQPIKDGDIVKFGCPKVIVGNWNWTQDDIAHVKAATGADVYSYLEMFWLPASGQFDGIDYSNVPGWQFCNNGNTPMIGDYSGSAHPNWYYVDLNSQKVIDTFKTYASNQKTKGFDGIFLDTGGQAMVYGQIWSKKSTCTQDPINTSRTAGDSFASLPISLAQLGMGSFVNIGIAPDLNVPKFRPDPTRSDCIASLPTCVPLNDIMQNANYVLNENVMNNYNDADWPHLIDVLYSDQNVPLNPARSKAKVVTMGRYFGPEDSTKPAHILYQWASMKLLNVSVNFGTGDDGVGGNRHGIAPTGLTNTQLGTPLSNWGMPGKLLTDGVHGIWYRRYSNGIIVLNNSSVTRITGVIPIFDDGSCRYLNSQPTNQAIGGAICNKTINRSLKPYTAEVITYSKLSSKR